MLERFKKHCETPITWGAYYKAFIFGPAAAYVIACVALYGSMKLHKYRSKHETEIEEETE